MLKLSNTSGKKDAAEPGEGPTPGDSYAHFEQKLPSRYSVASLGRKAFGRQSDAVASPNGGPTWARDRKH
jgi:hypothetical protein